MLASRGPQRAADLATSLDVTPSTASRMIERLVRKRLVGRTRTREDRRTVRVYLTRSGRDTVGAVTDRRRAEVAAILAAMPTDNRAALTSALRAFAGAAGEVPEQDWALGWDEAAPRACSGATSRAAPSRTATTAIHQPRDPSTAAFTTGKGCNHA